MGNGFSWGDFDEGTTLPLNSLKTDCKFQQQGGLDYTTIRNNEIFKAKRGSRRVGGAP